MTKLKHLILKWILGLAKYADINHNGKVEMVVSYDLETKKVKVEVK